jgi:hypothetical protein
MMTANQFNFRRFTYSTDPGFQWTGLNKPMRVGLEVLRVGILDAPEPHIDNAARCSPVVSLPEGREALSTLERLYRHAHVVLVNSPWSFQRHSPLTACADHANRRLETARYG